MTTSLLWSSPTGNGECYWCHRPAPPNNLGSLYIYLCDKREVAVIHFRQDMSSSCIRTHARTRAPRCPFPLLPVHVQFHVFISFLQRVFFYFNPSRSQIPPRATLFFSLSSIDVHSCCTPVVLFYVFPYTSRFEPSFHSPQEFFPGSNVSYLFGNLFI